MGKMSAVHAQLTELGHIKVKEMEDQIHRLKTVDQVPIRYIVSYLIKQYDVSLDTVLMIIEGAETHACSNAVQPRGELH